jgi:site-specific recombinase XerD
MVLGWISSRQQQGQSNATINRSLAAISCAFKTAYDDGLIDHAGPRIKRLPEDGGRDRVPTRMEVAQILKALRWSKPVWMPNYGGPDIKLDDPNPPRDSARLARFLYRTGVRLGEALSLWPGNIGGRHAGIAGALCVTLTDTKNGLDRFVPVPSACSSHIRRWYLPEFGYQDNVRVFGIPPSTFSAAWRAARERAGIGDWFVPHCLRHARATELVRAGTPIPVVAKILGHKDWSTTQRYTHPDALDCRKAMETRYMRPHNGANDWERGQQ